jgi:hypothetical protein
MRWPGAVQAAHDGADRHAELAGGFLVREAVDVDEFDDVTEPDGRAMASVTVASKASPTTTDSALRCMSRSSRRP